MPVTAFVVGCYDPPDTTERFAESVVITTRDEAADFGQFRTFFLRPEVRILDETQGIDIGPSEPETLAPSVADPLLDATRESLLERGYREADSSGDADLAVELVYLRAVTSEYYCYYWWDWYYWGYPDWYYYYPGSCTASTWRSGMLVTHAVDLMDAAPDLPEAPSTGVLQGIWYSGVYGAEAESVSYVQQRTVAGIRQAFIQSPYFTAAP